MKKATTKRLIKRMPPKTRNLNSLISLKRKVKKMVDYKIPLYKGNETEYEDVVYSFFRKIGEEFNFVFKAKKTNTKIDEILYSKEGNVGLGISDGYLFANLTTEDDKKDKIGRAHV
jgi:hypothetical protein